MTNTQQLLLNACETLGKRELEWIEADRLGQPVTKINGRIDDLRSLISELSVDYFQECNE